MAESHRRSTFWAWSLIGALSCLALFSGPTRAAEKLKVVTSFSILADVVRQVGGDRVEVRSLIGPDTDLHIFQPAPADAKEVMSAHLVVLNGLGLEGWADRLVKASGYKGPVIIAAERIKPRDASTDEHDHGHTAQRHARVDPHAWQDISNVKVYAAAIRDGLIGADPSHRTEYEARAQEYIERLDKLDAEVQAAFRQISPDKRRVITSHTAFNYFGAAYGIEFLAPQGVSGDSEPTAKGIAALIRQIKRERVKAVFVENISNPRVIERIVKETGVRPGGTLYSDALSSPAGPAATYEQMMRHNARLLSQSMM